MKAGALGKAAAQHAPLLLQPTGPCLTLPSMAVITYHSVFYH
jgi:hypothetical protein